METDEQTLRSELAIIRDTAGAAAAGYATTTITARGEALQRPIPEPVRLLYELIDPACWAKVVKPSIGLLTLQEAKWVSSDSPVIEGFAFGVGYYGDVILWCSQSPTYRPGSIVLANHDCEPELVCLGLSLHDWIRNLLAHGGEEYSYMNALVRDLSEPVRREVLGRQIALNPDWGWPAEELRRLQSNRR